MRVRSMVWMTVVALLAVSCSGDDGATTTSTVAATTSTSTTTTTTAAPTTTSAEPTSTTSAVPVTLSPSDPFVTTGGMGPIRVGMGVEEAATAAGFDLVGDPDPAVSETCYHVTPDGPGVYDEVSFMVLDDVIVRVEVRGEAVATTRSGAGIGISEDSLRAMFPGQLEDAEYSAGGGTGLAFVPRDEEDLQYRVVFAVEGGVVTEYRAGVLPGVAFTEGCL